MSAVVTEPRGTSVRDARPGVVRLLWQQVRHANSSFWRTPIAAFFTLAFPLVFLLLIGALAGNQVIDEATGLRLAQFLTPAMAVFGTAAGAFSTLAISVAVDREEGVLKRLRGSPLPAWIYVGGRVLSAAYTTGLSVLLLVLVGVTLYGVDIVWSKAAAGVVTLVVGISCLSALGLAVASLVSRTEAVSAVTTGVLMPLAFISGVFATGAVLPTWLDRIAGVFPLRHFVDALSEAFNPFHPGAGFRWGSLAVLLAWTVAGTVVAVRFFRWEPSPARAPTRRATRSAHAVDPVRTRQIAPGRVEEAGRPSLPALLRAQVRHANRAFWRNRAAAFFTLGFPVVLALLLPQVFGTGVVPGRAVELPQFLTPVMAVYGVAAASYLFLAQAVAGARERAVLKRAHGTPLPVWAYLGGQTGAAVLLSSVTVLVVVAAGVVAYDVSIVWAKLPALLIYLVLGIGCFTALGMALAAVAPSEKAAATLANVTLLPLAFVSDVFLIGDLPPTLDAIGWAFPLKHLANGVAATFDPTLPGAGFDVVHLLVLAAWAVVAALLAARLFRWEPGRATD